MSLYHEAATVLTKSQAEGVSIRTVVFAKKDWKSAPKLLLALASEAGKWSHVLSDVIEKSEILKIERQLTPVLAVVLAHDLLLAKRGVALPASHGLNVCIQRNRARLNAELTKARLRQGCSSIDQLRAKIEASQQDDASEHKTRHPRWVRINLILTSHSEQMTTTFAEFREVSSIGEIVAAGNERLLFHDPHIPNLLAIPSAVDLTTSKAYRQGHIIFQDKASCFPAYMIDPQVDDGDIVDGCAAPGNKTTHLAAILHDRQQRSEPETAQRIFACEKDLMRAKTLAEMVTLAGGDDLIEVRQGQNFLKLDPYDSKYDAVSKLLLDPSCSGSGIVQRDEHMIKIQFPGAKQETTTGKKRKREAVLEEVIEEEPVIEGIDQDKLDERLSNLADFQLRIVLHAMSFPAAKQISYSTCSIHAKENEEVVIKSLLSEIGQERGWKMHRRDEQVPGIRKWHIRGDKQAVDACLAQLDTERKLKAEDISQGCVKCDKRGKDGTMGFFVASLIRSQDLADTEPTPDDDAEWAGFVDS